jgi:hypothetical protein
MGRRFLIAGLLLAVLVTAAWLLIRPAREWQMRRMAAASKAALASGDLRSASLSARQILRADPANRRAIEILARVSESARSPDAILWQQRLVQASPGDPAPAIELARIAMGFGEKYIAEKALAEITATQRNTVAFLSTAAALAVDAGRPAQADELLKKAIRLEPANELLQLNRATVQLKSADPALLVGARDTLVRLASRPALRAAALRALVADARHAGDSARALQLVRDLTRDPAANMGDWLLLLEELQHAGSPDFATELYFQKQSAMDPARTGLLLEWMNAHGLAPEALTWVESMPKEAAARMPVPLMKAEALSLCGKWNELRAHLAGGEWGDLEFLREAFRARASYEADAHRKTSEFTARWDRAIVDTAGNPAALSMLAKLVEGWGWQAEAAQAWWLFAARKSGQRPALEALYRIYSDTKNTRELQRVAARIIEVEPDNPVAINNAAMFSLLLGINMEAAVRMAVDNHGKYPREPAFTSTLAFARFKQGDIAAGIALMQALPPQSLKNPSTAACMGILLSASGRKDAARPHLEFARASSAIFPEERTLVEQALNQP